MRSERARIVAHLLNIAGRRMSNQAIMKCSKVAQQLPTLTCAWCNTIIKPGGLKISHGICQPCAKLWFGKLHAKTLRPLAA